MRGTALPLCLTMLAAGAVAQKTPDPSALRKAVAVVLTPLYVAPDDSTAQVGSVRPGQDVGVEGTAPGYVHVFNGVDGWMPNRGLVFLDQPSGAEVIFGAAVVLQAQAEADAAERTTAQDAARLYARVYDDFGTSPRAGEALFRSADILWQLELGDQPRRREASEQEFPDDGTLKKVESKFPDSPWAARAGFDLIAEHLTCGELTVKPDCIAKAVSQYDDYLKKYPHSPVAAEAAYDAMFDCAVGATVYGGPSHPDADKAKQFKAEVASRAQTITGAYNGTDWAAKATLVAYQVAQGVPVYPPSGGAKP